MVTAVPVRPRWSTTSPTISTPGIRAATRKKASQVGGQEGVLEGVGDHGEHRLLEPGGVGAVGLTRPLLDAGVQRVDVARQRKRLIAPAGEVDDAHRRVDRLADTCLWFVLGGAVVRGPVEGRPRLVRPGGLWLVGELLEARPGGL